jgi:hypothetical protein
VIENNRIKNPMDQFLECVWALAESP